MIVRVYSDESGTTHLSPVRFSEHQVDVGGSRYRSLADVPTTSLSVVELLEHRERKDIHAAPRRQFVIVMRGEFEVTTTSGDTHRFSSGDCLLADDVGSNGHTFEDIGQEPLVLMTVGVVDGWVPPAG